MSAQVIMCSYKVFELLLFCAEERFLYHVTLFLSQLFTTLPGECHGSSLNKALSNGTMKFVFFLYDGTGPSMTVIAVIGRREEQ